MIWYVINGYLVSFCKCLYIVGILFLEESGSSILFSKIWEIVGVYSYYFVLNCYIMVIDLKRKF